MSDLLQLLQKGVLLFQQEERPAQEVLTIMAKCLRLLSGTLRSNGGQDQEAVVRISDDVVADKISVRAVFPRRGGLIEQSPALQLTSSDLKTSGIPFPAVFEVGSEYDLEAVFRNPFNECVVSAIILYNTAFCLHEEGYSQASPSFCQKAELLYDRALKVLFCQSSAIATTPEVAVLIMAICANIDELRQAREAIDNSAFFRSVFWEARRQCDVSALPQQTQMILDRVGWSFELHSFAVLQAAPAA